MNRTQFREQLTAEHKPLLLDGAMGTLLYSYGAAMDRPLCLLNIENPKLVAEVHRAYIEAGADVIETNTFDANRFKLGKHGSAEKAAELNSAAVTIARRVIDSTFRPVLLAGSIGPLAVTLAPLGRVTQREARAAFMEQINALVDPPHTRGVDWLILETQTNLHEIETAVEVARSLAPHIPIIAQMTFNRDDRTLMGDTPLQVALRLKQLGVDALGVNCSSGPAQLLRLLTAMHQVVPDMPLAGSPNAGWPEDIEGGRVLYPASPAYFAQHVGAYRTLGVRLMGGCCGTTADHIAAMRREIDQPTAVSPEARPLPTQLVGHKTETRPTNSPDQPTQLARALQKGEFFVSVELTPPHGTAVQKLLASARSLHEAGATFFNMADMPQARMRMSAWAAAYLLQQNLGHETILHVPTRGRNLLRLQADLLAAHALGLRNLFVLMGERAKVGDYPEGEDVYDIMPSGLIKLIKEQFNAGVDQLDRALDQPTNFLVGCGVNLNSPNPTREMRLLHENIQNGADFALSRLVFDVDKVREFMAGYQREYGRLIPLIAAVQPLPNAAVADFLHHEVPGLLIPEKYRQALRLSDDEWQGVNIAQELLLGLRDVVQGVVIVPYAGRYDLAADVLDVLA
ncbi:MAG: bifunctional homocysteine S-methyltransferase/methylenetetrahydrofolate reductase [Chloroflexi bacterium]|nr:bifunctional homocysteine S-methyltransferase/methylenetetrahydrofolate reductase [Chloroflexota bacterium]